jgi:DNA (cytosine-5)-methyltransferase 1
VCYSSSMNIPAEIKNKRLGMGLTQSEFAQLLGLEQSGERTVRGWENGEHFPTDAKLAEIRNLPSSAPLKNAAKKHLFTFIDLFAGIGGIRLAFQKNGGRCVFTSEWDKFAQKTYAANFGELPCGDITKIATDEILEHDVLLAGFPCQAFSQAGLKKGFADTRGTMFFEIQRIVAHHQPSVLVLENVKQLKGHNKGETLKTILQILRGESYQEIPDDVPLTAETRKALNKRLNYWVDYKVLRARDFGVPQNRERIFIVAFNKDKFPNVDFDKAFKWPKPTNLKTHVGDILERHEDIDPKYTISEKLLDGHERRKIQHIAKGNGFGFSVFKSTDEYTNTLSARYYKDGSEILIDQSKYRKRPRKLTPRECARLQGFPEKFIVNAVSDVQIYKQFGNSVTVPVVEAVAKSVKTVLLKIRKAYLL